MDTIFRIFVLADIHRSVREMINGYIPEDPSKDPADLWPNHMRRIGLDKARSVLARIVKGCRQAWLSALAYARAYRPDLIVIAGDATGGFREQGIGHESVQPLIGQMAQELNAIAPTRMSGGNHESGYGKDRGDFGGFQPKSITAQREAFGPLWWDQEFGKLLVVGITTSIETEPSMSELASEQRLFLQKCAAQFEQRPWVLVLHDLGFVDRLLQIIGASCCMYLALRNCQAIVVGDLHSPGKFRLVRSLKLATADCFLSRSKVELLDKVVFCPSTAPLWWEGFGALTLEWNDTLQKLISTQVVLLRPPGYVPLPTESFWTCLKWCVR